MQLVTPAGYYPATPKGSFVYFLCSAEFGLKTPKTAIFGNEMLQVLQVAYAISDTIREHAFANPSNQRLATKLSVHMR